MALNDNIILSPEQAFPHLLVDNPHMHEKSKIVSLVENRFKCESRNVKQKTYNSFLEIDHIQFNQIVQKEFIDGYLEFCRLKYSETEYEVRKKMYETYIEYLLDIGTANDKENINDYYAHNNSELLKILMNNSYTMKDYQYIDSSFTDWLVHVNIQNEVKSRENNKTMVHLLTDESNKRLLSNHLNFHSKERNKKYEHWSSYSFLQDLI